MIEIQKLTRNFLEQPIEKKEEIQESDICYLFIELNLTIQEVADIFGCKVGKVNRFKKLFNLKKTKEQINKCRKNTVFRKYGVDNVSKNSNIKKKKEQTCIKHYGVNNPAKSKEISDKIKTTNLERYGVDNSFKNKDIQNKMKLTCIERYGVDNVAKSSIVQEKYKQTCLKKYGTTNPQQNNEIRYKTENTIINKYGKETIFGSNYFKQKAKQTFIEKYGVDNPAKSSVVQEKYKQTCRQRYGEDFATKKMTETKRKNGTFNTSKVEKECFEKIKLIEPQAINGYQEERYPFLCDIYIPSLDIFIELNFHWTHGKKPFDERDQQCQKILKQWKQKAEYSDYFKNAIYTWTNLDVRKIIKAKQNKLNYFALYDIKEFEKLYEKIKEELNCK